EGDALLDLDGVVDSGIVLATADNFLGTVGAATLRVVGPLRDEFSGRMEIGRRDSILFSQPWILDGSLDFFGSHGEDLATLVSPELTVHGSATIAVESGQANIATPLVMNGGTFTVARGTTVDFNGPATFGTGATFAMGDRDITVSVTRDVHIQQPTVDLDGGGVASNVVWNVSSGRLLQIEGDHPEVFGATINMSSDSTLTLGGDWIFAAEATLRMSTSSATLNIGGFTRILPDVDLEGNGPFNTVNIAENGILVLNGNIANNPGNVFHGTFVNRGTLGIDGPGSSWTLGNGGSLELRNDGSAPDVQGDLILNQGVISGDGRFVASVENQLNGRIEPGFGEETGRLEWEDANLTLQTGSTVAFDIGGRAIAATYDRIDAQSVVINGGLLELGLINGFLPNAADVFRILNASSLDGVFDNISNGERLTTTDGLGSFLVNYGASSTFASHQVVLSDFQLNALTADVDGDNDVDAADFLIIQRTNPALILDWQTQYGIVPSLAVSQAHAIPEPTTWAMLLLGAAALLSRPRNPRC
ncbi:MAG: PEP-CTERM sorting domain-containing protein, partial [Aeoliella sp.]